MGSDLVNFCKFEKMHPMNTHNEIILLDLKNMLQSRFKDDLEDLILFGSQLSDEKHENSDFDILIILKQKPDWTTHREISDICFEIDLKYGIVTDTHLLGADELHTPRGKQPIFQNALLKGMHV
jgi:uncharacterized protein